MPIAEDRIPFLLELAERLDKQLKKYAKKWILGHNPKFDPDELDYVLSQIFKRYP